MLEAVHGRLGDPALAVPQQARQVAGAGLAAVRGDSRMSVAHVQ